MSERSFSTDGIERRGFLSAVAVGLGGAGLSHHALARESGDATYALQQGDQCVPITPLSGDETVEEFYDYRTPNTDPSGSAYSSYGTTHLQRPETSILFLYDGPKGLSLVVVHDKLNDGTNGGAVTFRFGDLTKGEWVVGDDIYDGETNYDRFQETETGWKVDWTWGSGRSDGGAYRPLGDDFAVTVDPSFNEEAALYGEHYEGKISDWQVLSGDRSDPDRTSLSLTEPITIRAGGCGSLGTPTTTVEETTEETTEDDQTEGSVSLDVEVGSRVNPKSHGRLPVVIHSSAEFDATTIEPGSVELQPGGAAPGKRIRTDANGDGRTDLKLLFWMDAVGIDGDTGSVKLTGRTRDGRKVAGTADVRLTPNGDDDDDDDDEGDDHGKDEKDGKGGKDENGNEGGEGGKHGKDDKHGGDDDNDEWEKKEEELEEKREKAEEKWEEKEEKWEKKKEKWEKKKEKHEEKDEDDD